MNLRTNQKGFTIVELLIVIVVIAILAAISIVAFTGIQERARTSSGQSLASQVEKKAQAYYTIENSYPATFAEFNDGTVNEAALEGITTDNLHVVTTGITASAPAVGEYDNGETVSYRQCDSGTGAQIGYWDFAADTPGAEVKELGTGC